MLSKFPTLARQKDSLCLWPQTDVTQNYYPILQITSSMAFLLYNIAKHQMSQRLLYQEVGNLYQDNIIKDIENFKNETPYLQACIKETLR